MAMAFIGPGPAAARMSQTLIAVRKRTEKKECSQSRLLGGAKKGKLKAEWRLLIPPSRPSQLGKQRPGFLTVPRIHGMMISST